MTSPRRRLDVEMARRGLAVSRSEAHSLIASGRVRVAGAIADKPARLVAASDPVIVSGSDPGSDPGSGAVTGPGSGHGASQARYASRGGVKLAAALARFGICVSTKRAFDLGASTGGFTDCLLRRGARAVVAVDVGHGQIDHRLRCDERVQVIERCNVRTLDAAAVERLGGPAALVTADLSFISLRTVMPNLAVCAADGADVVMLVKPQFEAGRREASRARGIIRSPQTWLRTVTAVAERAAQEGLALRAAAASPVRGAKGNAEFFLHCVAGAGTCCGDAGAMPAEVLRTLASDLRSVAAPPDRLGSVGVHQAGLAGLAGQEASASSTASAAEMHAAIVHAGAAEDAGAAAAGPDWAG